MVNFLRKFIQDERGSYLVIFAAGMFFFLGLTAVVTDIGFLSFQRRHLQNTADAAALAGARELPLAISEDVALDYAVKNGVEDGEDKTSVLAEKNSDRNKITVTITKEYSRFMGMIFGLVNGSTDDYQLNVRAVASRDLGDELLPLAALQYDDLLGDPDNPDWNIEDEDWYDDIDEFAKALKEKIGEVIEILIKPNIERGNAGFLNFSDYSYRPGHGADTIVSVLNYGMTEDVNKVELSNGESDGDSLQTKPGTNQSTKNALEERLEKNDWEGYIVAFLPSVQLSGRETAEWGEWLIVKVTDMVLTPHASNEIKLTGIIDEVYNVSGCEWPWEDGRSQNVQLLE